MSIKISKKNIDRSEYLVRACYTFMNENREPVGRVFVRHYCLYKSTDMEYAILPEHQNKGYATEAVKLVLKDLFCNKILDGHIYLNAYGKASKTMCDAVGLQISKSNIASLKVAQRNGFKITEYKTSYAGQITSEMFKKPRNTQQELELG